MSAIAIHPQGTISTPGSGRAGTCSRAELHLVTTDRHVAPRDLRLVPTARGRRLLRAAAVALALLMLLFGGRAVAGGHAAPVAVDTYTVSAGETLWAIAAAYTPPQGDVRDTVSALVDLNNLAGGALRAGEQILVPVS